tara:strand:- start:3350 stop:4159 length:810 start_codon:yes stop_codon:yes gene_type:complete
MTRLSREIRFSLVPPDPAASSESKNSWAGWPSTNAVVPSLVLSCVIEGDPDSGSGYLCDISIIDDLLRSIATDLLISQPQRFPTGELMVLGIYREFLNRWTHPARLVSISLATNPYLEFSIHLEQDMNLTAQDDVTVQLTQQFEFSAAHRLHCSQLSDEENRQLFGKCNNPAGHGHNYVVDVTLSNPVEEQTGAIFSLGQFEETVKQRVIDQLDHKHLNLDVDYFSDLNPTVENIAAAVFEWLDGHFERATLERVRVYETPKTWAECSR